MPLRSSSFSALLSPFRAVGTIYSARAARFLIISYQRRNGISWSRNCAMGSNSVRPFNSARSGETHNSRLNGRVITIISGNRIRFAALQSTPRLRAATSAARFLGSTLPPGRKKEPQSITHLHFDRRPECADRQKIINVNTRGAVLGRSVMQNSRRRALFACRGSAHLLSFLRI